MHLNILALALLAAAVPTPGTADGRFAVLRGQAQRLDSLAPFLERYVGNCRDEFTRADCEQNVKRIRRGLTGSVFSASVAEQTLDLVKPQRTRAGYRFVVTPFIDGGGLALTHGEPRKQDAAGRPLINFIVLDGALPDGMDEMALESALRTGRVEMEVLFRPEGTWKLKRKGEPGFYEGVRARFLGIRLLESRTGAEIASKVLSG
ncbi:MAG TPA: DUF6066 family protein [Anaeromyxobacteraceae bacterium]|nr:DUF6066 family protein [Anaeromyxobacteraceae bacterium]